MEKIYYVYVHYRGDNGQPFYVGKGKGRRASTKWSRNKFWNNIVGKHGFTYKILFDGLSEQCAYTMEKCVIAHLRRAGYNLCNTSDGGEGCSTPNYKLRKPVNCSNGMRFDMITDAAEWSGAPRRNIADCAEGKVQSAGGYAWWYDGCEPKIYVSPKARMAASQSKRVFRSDGVSFPSLSAAAASVNASIGNISTAARTPGLIRHGYTWSYPE